MVVAMFNEAATIGACLQSLASQDYPSDLLEVLVYDGGSTDGSRERADAIVSLHPGWFVRHNERRIQAAAWNAGMRAATGDIGGIVSGHAELEPTYVRMAVDALTATGADMVGGPVHAIGVGTIGRAAAIAISTPFGVGGARHHYLTEAEDVDTVFMGVCRRDTWLRFPFDETMVRNQDDEMSYRLLDDGGRIVCDPSIRSRYHNRSTLPSLWRQFFEYGRWKVRVLRAHPRQARRRHFAPVLLVAAFVVGAALSTILDLARVGTVALAAIYALAIVLAVLRYGDRREPMTSLSLVLVYPTVHFAYGSGMAMGLVQHVRGLTRDQATPPGPAA